MPSSARNRPCSRSNRRKVARMAATRRGCPPMSAYPTRSLCHSLSHTLPHTLQVLATGLHSRHCAVSVTSVFLHCADTVSHTSRARLGHVSLTYRKGMANMRQGERTDLEPSARLPEVVSQPDAPFLGHPSRMIRFGVDAPSRA
jgi:hypothetical protein